MTTAEKAKAILIMIQQEEKKARLALIEARVNLAGQEAKDECWRAERDDMSWKSRYDTSYERECLVRAEKRHQDITELLDFAMEHFISLIPDYSGVQ